MPSTTVKPFAPWALLAHLGARADVCSFVRNTLQVYNFESGRDLCEEQFVHDCNNGRTPPTAKAESCAPSFRQTFRFWKLSLILSYL